MPDGPKETNKELIPASNDNLTTSGSNLIERGLKLLNEIKKQDLTLAFADYDNGGIGETLNHVTRNFFSNNQYNIINKWSYYGDNLLSFAESGSVDIFILNLNSVTNFDETLNVYERLEYSLSIVYQIKRIAPKSIIISYSGFIDEVEQKAKQAGADYYLALPIKFENFREIVGKCIETLFKNQLPMEIEDRM